MTDHTTPAAASDGSTRRARSLGLLAGSIVAVEGVIAAFLLLMSTLTTADVGAGLLLGAVAALAGLVAAAVLWRRARTAAGPDGVAGVAWVCRLLPFGAAAVAVVLAVVGVMAWLGVALAFFAPAPAAVLAMVVRYLVPGAATAPQRS